MAEDPFAGIEAQVGAGSLGGIDYQPSSLDAEPIAADPRPAGPHTGGVRDITDVQSGSLGGDGGEEEIGLSPEEEAHLTEMMAETAPNFGGDPTLVSSTETSPPATVEPTQSSSTTSSSPTESSPSTDGAGGSSGSEETAEEPAPPAEAGAAKNAPRVYFILEQGLLENDQPYWFKVGEQPGRTHEQALRAYLKDNGISWGERDAWVVVTQRDFRRFAPKPATSLRLGEVT